MNIPNFRGSTKVHLLPQRGQGRPLKKSNLEKLEAELTATSETTEGDNSAKSKRKGKKKPKAASVKNNSDGTEQRSKKQKGSKTKQTDNRSNR